MAWGHPDQETAAVASGMKKFETTGGQIDARAQNKGGAVVRLLLQNRIGC
jgi:hypothetical protein